jgi:hypothetical protein
MAKRRASSEPSSKQGVLITLGICIPLIIGLGVATYFGFAGQKERDDKAADATKKLNDAQKAGRTAEDKVALLKAYMGITLEKNEEPAFAAAHDQSLTGSDQGTINMIKELDQTVVWDSVKRAPKDTLLNVIKSQKNQLDAAQKAQDKINKDMAKAYGDIRASVETNKKGEQDLENRTKAAEENALKAQQSKLDSLVKAQAEINRLRDEEDDVKKKSELEKGEKLATIKKLEAESKILQKKNDLLQIKVAPVYLPDFEQPQGKIDAIDRESRFAYINIGASDGVKPLLTFSVYSPGTEGNVNLYGAEGTQAERDKKRASHEPVPKGTLEVVSIMGPHASKARITGVRDQNQDPLVRGDLIFNPIWRANQHMHVAVTGMINLTGDGRDRSAEFIQSLQRMGVIIDSYLDTKELQIKGPGMTVNTNYLVEGEHPKVDNMLALAGSSIGARSVKIDDLINQMKNQAKDLGISTMTARNFMTLVGYRVPKNVIPFAGTSGYGSLTGGDGKKEGEEKKEEKKEGDEAPKAKPKAKAKPVKEDEEMKEDIKEDKKKATDKDKEDAKKGDAKDDKKDNGKDDKDKDAPKDKDK